MTAPGGMAPLSRVLAIQSQGQMPAVTGAGVTPHPAHTLSWGSLGWEVPGLWLAPPWKPVPP